MSQHRYSKESLRRATDKASNAIRRRTQIQLGLTKHQTEESAQAEINKLTKIIKANWNQTCVFLSQRTGIKQYREMSAKHVMNSIKTLNDNEFSIKSGFIDDMHTLRNYINAVTT